MEHWLGYIRLILEGAQITAALTILGCLLAFPVALVAGLGRLSRFPAIRAAATVYVEFFRGTSIFVQLFWAYFVLPLFGLQLDGFAVGVVVLGLNLGAYSAEVVRGAIQSIPRSQKEACIALNLSARQSMQKVIFPQAMVVMLPTLGNNAIELLKATSIVSVISLADMTFQAQIVRSQTGSTIIPFSTILMLYFAFSMMISIGFRWLETRLSRGLDGVR